MAVEGELAPTRRSRGKLSYPASGVTTAGVASGSSLSTTHGSAARPAFRSRPPPMAAGHRDHRPDRAEPLGVEHVRGHGHLRRPCATSAPTARTCARSASTASRCLRDQGLAARLAPQARSGEVAAVPAVPRAQRALVAQARRVGRMPDRDLADLHGVQEGPQAARSTSSRATASAARRTRTTTPTTTPARSTRSIRAATSSRICCCRSFRPE